MDEEKNITKDEERIAEERKKKIISFLKKTNIWTLGILIVILILGVYIRSLPMTDHGGHPGLWDITTNTWTLGPDLDPWLFLRTAKTIVEKGSIPKNDTMRYVPRGFDTSVETKLLPYMISWTYYTIHAFDNSANIELAGVVFPVIMFALTIISFFLFVREVFIRKSEESIIKANIIALISTLLMIVIPEFVSRTIAGIPEKESAGFFFLFLAFYLFLKSWKSEKLKNNIIFGVLAGAATAAMGLIWGGVLYIFIPIALASMVAFVLNKIHKKEFFAYLSWIIVSFGLLSTFSNKYLLKNMITSLDSGLAFLVLVIAIIHLILWNTKISNVKWLKETKLPRNIISIIVAFVLIIIATSVLFNPYFIVEKGKAIHQTIFKPTSGRWVITVAENRQPYFTEWGRSFGPFIKNIPLLFWLFFIGSFVLFKKMLDKINKKDAWILTGLYIFFLCGIIFSRYAPHPNIMDGEGLLSKLFYYGSAFLLIGFTVYYYNEYNKKGNKNFEEIDYEFLLLSSLFVLTLMTARGAIRLIMVLAPITPIFAGFLVVESVDRFRKAKDETWKIILGAAAILIIVMSFFIFWNFYNAVKAEAYNFIPSGYNVQWQKAMNWVRDETPKNAVFAHWWDYGYWLQSIGERATALDGGNAITYWNYLMGRLVLTGDSQEKSLEFLYNHDATHLLIDSSDIGKYGAFSSIGSDKNFDRYSWIGTFILDEKQTQETKNQTLLVYSGGIALDEDLKIIENEKEVWLPGQRTGVGLIILPMEKSGNETKFAQPYIMTQYNGVNHKVEMRYLSINERFMDFKSGAEGCAFIFPKLESDGQRITSENRMGAAMFISPRLMKGYLAQKYIMDDPLKKFPNFKLAHTEPSLIVESLNSQGMNLPDIIYFNGVQGPIKIWAINYTGKEKINQEYLDTDFTKYIDWQL